MVSPSLTRWLLPDAAMMVSLVVLFWVLLAGEGPARLFRDSDTGWHIRTGERILAGAGLPRTDPYSYSRAGEPWFAWEWGADVLMGAAHRWDGLRGVAMLYTVAGTAAVWVWFQLHWAVEGNFFFACGMASAMVTTLGLHWLARPHVLSWLLLTVALLALERAPRRAGTLAGFLAAGCVWANLHASFFFLPGLAVLYAVGAWLRGWMWGGADRPAGFYLGAALAAAAGSLVNPYGWELHRHLARYLTDGELLARIGEYQTFNFHAAGATQVLVGVLLIAIAAPLTLGRRRPEHFLLCCGLLAVSLRSARALPVAALLLLPLVNGALTAALARVELREKLRARLDAFLAYSARLRALERRAAGWVPALLGLALSYAVACSPAVAAQMGFPKTEFPVEAAAAVATLPAEARILAPDKFGGYLIYRFAGERKVYFDGRSDFYGVAFLKQYIRLIEARPGWRRQVEEAGFTHALLPVNYSLVEGFRQWGWTELYRDETAILFQRN